MDNYRDIFNQRGASYHEAMRLCPEARIEEFKAVLGFVDLHSKQTLLDIPAGGGYLSRYLPANIEYLAFDFSGAFDTHNQTIHDCEEAIINLKDASADIIVSLAGLHHVVNRKGFFQEAKRILKRGGRFILGDVKKDSKVDPFLNQFVNEWNSQGHQGRFITEEEPQLLANVGFEVLHCENRKYSWQFPDRNTAETFFRLLFCLDKNPPADKIEDQLNTLGVVIEPNCFRVGWELQFIVVTR